MRQLTTQFTAPRLSLRASQITPGVRLQKTKACRKKGTQNVVKSTLKGSKMKVFSKGPSN